MLLRWLWIKELTRRWQVIGCLIFLQQFNMKLKRHGYGVVRDFAGHGIGKSMHEDPEILNYGIPGKGPMLKTGMAFGA